MVLDNGIAMLSGSCGGGGEYAVDDGLLSMADGRRMRYGDI